MSRQHDAPPVGRSRRTVGLGGVDPNGRSSANTRFSVVGTRCFVVEQNLRSISEAAPVESDTFAHAQIVVAALVVVGLVSGFEAVDSANTE